VSASGVADRVITRGRTNHTSSTGNHAYTAVNKEMISPHVMIDAALHVLAAWVASSQTHSPTGKREEEVDELLEIRRVASRAAPERSLRSVL